MIENNSLSFDQVTAIINGKKVLAPPQDICEAENAFQAYNRFFEFSPYAIMDLLTAHQVLMKELVRESGVFRKGNVEVFRGKKFLHGHR